MNFIKNTFVYLLLLVFDVKTIVNEAEKLENCVEKLSSTLLDSNEKNSNLLALIDQSTVILKAFCSENLINIVDKDHDDDEDGDEVENNEDDYVNMASRKSSQLIGPDDIKKAGSKSYDTSDNIVIDNEKNLYSDDYFYNTNDDRKLKTLMTFSPITVYKGLHLLRQLESYNNQEFYQVKGQLNATLELEHQQRELYQQKCVSNPKINIQGQLLNKNHLIEKQIRKLVPGQLIIFAESDASGKLQRNRLIVKTNGIVRWKPKVENFVWNNLGWSGWSEWSACSKSCRGIQQRYRQCLTNQQNTSTTIMERSTDKMDSFMSATNAQQSQHLCNGYNIEQRQCNLFECKDAVNLLSLTSSNTMTNARMSLSQESESINQVVDKNDFTIMLTIRSQVNKHHVSEMINQHLMSLQSDSSTSSQMRKHSSLTISLIDSGLKVVQEKNEASEMFAIKLNLFDLHWHQIALSFRSDGLITCYIDCMWDSSFVMARGSFEVPQPNARIELNSKLNGLIEWKQLSIISGNHERSQCSNERTPIFDNNKLFERIFNDESN